MNNYGIFFTLGSTVVRLPLNPAELPDTLSGTNETYNILGIGEVTALRKPAQRTISISGLFPGRAESFVHTPNQFWVPEKYIDFFRSAMNDRSVLIYTPVRYMEDGTPFATNDIGFKCTVEGFEVTEKGGETGDFYYSLSIKEYRDYLPQKVKVEFKNNVKTVTETQTRSVPADVITVGSSVKVNGPVASTSSGKSYSGGSSKTTSTNTEATVKRVEPKQPYPYCVENARGTIGWTTKASLTQMSVRA